MRPFGGTWMTFEGTWMASCEGELVEVMALYEGGLEEADDDRGES